MSFDWTAVPDWLAPALEEVVDAVQARLSDPDLARAEKAEADLAALREHLAAARTEIETHWKVRCDQLAAHRDRAERDHAAARAEIEQLRAYCEEIGKGQDRAEANEKALHAENIELRCDLADLRAQSAAATRLAEARVAVAAMTPCDALPADKRQNCADMADYCSARGICRNHIGRMDELTWEEYTALEAYRAARTGTHEPGKEGA